ncbi:MAG: hypothetical protein KDA52_17165, partial [Planctomycetaceae bacterium]|nr:hypothetical protein [Planctomycetaceae bacterium]
LAWPDCRHSRSDSTVAIAERFAFDAEVLFIQDLGIFWFDFSPIALVVIDCAISLLTNRSRHDVLMM